MATHPHDVSVSVRVPDVRLLPEPGPGVLVPDVVMQSEQGARTRIEAVGLRAGRRMPGPRPANRRAEVVVRTHPGVGTRVEEGSSVDYELLPGEPVEVPQPESTVEG